MKPAILIITYNSEKYIEKCLDTLIKNGSDFLIWIIDNNSTDRTLDLVKKYAGIKLIALYENTGYGKAINVGLVEVYKVSDIAVIMNPDITASSQDIENFVSGIVAKKLDLAQPRIMLPNGKVNTLGSEVTFFGLSYPIGYGENKDFEYHKKIAAISGACFAITKNAYEKIGGFDEEIFLYAEDTEYALRAKIAGLNVGRVDTATVTHVYSYSISDKKIQWLEFGRLWIVTSLFSTRSIIFLFPLFLFFELGVKIQYPNVSRFGLYKKIYERRKALREKRRKVAGSRKISDHELFADFSPTVNFSSVDSLPVKIFNAIAFCYCKLIYLLHLI